MLAREPPAARLERISEPGGGTISRLVYDQIDGKLALRFRNLGPQKLKNITKPIEVFAIEFEWTGRGHELRIARRRCVPSPLPSKHALFRRFVAADGIK